MHAKIKSWICAKNQKALQAKTAELNITTQYLCIDRKYIMSFDNE